MSASAAGEVIPEPEDPRLVAANLSVGARLFASAMAFVFMAFVFAFFYLKATNSNGYWRPAAVSPSQGWGIVILVCVLGATAMFELVRRGMAGGGAPSVAFLGIALGLAFAVIVAQIIQYLTIGFGDSGGGYASVFYGWTSLFLAFWLGAVYSVETMLATLLRSAREAGGAADTAAMLRPSADATMVYLYSCAAIALVAWVLLYLIK